VTACAGQAEVGFSIDTEETDRAKPESSNTCEYDKQEKIPYPHAPARLHHASLLDPS
jgi:hypothetical protein